MSSWSSARKRILVVDDDVETLMGLQLILEENYVVDVTCNPMQALQILTHLQFDAVIVDLMMPMMDGTKLIEQIRKRRLTSAPILLMSAYPDARETAALAGAADAICKPFEVESLERKLVQILCRSLAAELPV